LHIGEIQGYPVICGKKEREIRLRRNREMQGMGKKSTVGKFFETAGTFVEGVETKEKKKEGSGRLLVVQDMASRRGFRGEEFNGKGKGKP